MNASLRFRYTLDLKKEEEKEQRRRIIRDHAQVIRAAQLFHKLAGEKKIVLGTSVTPPTPSVDYAIGLEQLASMTKDHNYTALQRYGGFQGSSNDIISSDVGAETMLLLSIGPSGEGAIPFECICKKIPVNDT